MLLLPLLPIEQLKIFYPLGLLSMIFFIGAGVTDMLDGPLARNIKDGQSEFGAILDSVADMILVFIGILYIMPKMRIVEGGLIYDWLWPAYIIALSFKIGSIFVGRIKHKELVMLHTYTNKVLGVILWVVPVMYYFFVHRPQMGGVANPYIVTAVNIYIIIVLVAIFVITTEEILINLLLIKPSRNLKSIFDVKAINEQTRAEMGKLP